MSTPIRLLGGVEVDGIDLGPAKQRAVLATLLLAAGRSVATDDIVARVWGADSPPGARPAVRAYVCRLRALVAETRVLQIVRTGGGYRAEFDPDHLDLLRFRRLVSDARSAVDGPTALAAYADALDLWRGDPLTGVSSAWLDAQRQTLLRECRCAELDYNDVALRLDEPGRILAALVDHHAEDAYDERVAGQLMLALRASGRAAEALRVYDRVRRTLRDELGTEPGAELREAHQLVLRPDCPGPSRPGSARPVPHQLPAALAGFVERVAEQRLLDAALRHSDAGSRVAILTGIGGAGKTSFALHWGHQRAGAYPDGQLFVDLHGFDPDRPPLRAEAALRGFLLALGADPAALPADVAGLAAMYRTMTSERRVLVVADNVRDSDQVRPLLPAGPGCATLITSRSALAGIVTNHAAHLIDVGMLDAAQARTLMRNRLGAERVDHEATAVDALVQRCAGLPLALAIASGRAVLTPRVPLAALADDLCDDATTLDSLRTGEPGGDVRAAIAMSVSVLSPQTARAFGLMGLSPATTLSASSFAAVAGLPRGAAAAALGDLTAARLIEQTCTGRYQMHDLVRLHATDVGRADPQAVEAVRRLLRYYLDSVAEPVGVPTRHDFVAIEAESLIAAIDLAFADCHDDLGCDLAIALEAYLSARGCWPDVVRATTAAVGAATRLADSQRLVRAHVALGRGLIGVREFDDAARHLSRALALARRLGNSVQLAQAHRAQARLAAHQHRPSEALRHDEQALRLYLAAGDRMGEATAYNAIGWHLAHLGKPARALVVCRRGLAIFVDLADRGGQAMTLDSIGLALELLDRPVEAQDHYQRSAQQAGELGWHVMRAEILRRLERSYLRTGQQRAARQAGLDATETLQLTGALAA